jgi:hypothetical protein
MANYHYFNVLFKAKTAKQHARGINFKNGVTNCNAARNTSSDRVSKNFGKRNTGRHSQQKVSKKRQNLT